MSFLRTFESCSESLLRIVIGGGLVWIGVAEGRGYGAFLDGVGVIFVIAGLAEAWFALTHSRRLPRRRATGVAHPALISCDVPVFYATTDGQTKRIAERLAILFHERGVTSRAIDVASPDADHVDWSHVRAAVLGASLHAGRHQRSAGKFARAHVHHLNERPSAFVSVSLSAASSAPKERDAATELAKQMPASVGWHPQHVACIAGRLAYTKYGWLTRLVMKRIARKEGAPTDTSRDYELTNWEKVTDVADLVARAIDASGSHRAA
jgi:menaquinone-dependent protoporphyrinogen oxidase